MNETNQYICRMPSELAQRVDALLIRRREKISQLIPEHVRFTRNSLLVALIEMGCDKMEELLCP